MQTVLTISMLVTILVFFAKKSFCLTIQSNHNITLQQSFFCWFTKQDIAASQQTSTRWALVLNNVTNILLAICCLLILVSAAIVILGLMG